MALNKLLAANSIPENTDYSGSGFIFNNFINAVRKEFFLHNLNIENKE